MKNPAGFWLDVDLVFFYLIFFFGECVAAVFKYAREHKGKPRTS